MRGGKLLNFRKFARKLHLTPQLPPPNTDNANSSLNTLFQGGKLFSDGIHVLH